MDARVDGLGPTEEAAPTGAGGGGPAFGLRQVSPSDEQSGPMAEVQIAGLQLDFPAQQIPGLAEVWVPFDEAIVIGW